MSAGSIPLFAGGTDADYLGGIQPDVIGRYNYFHRPLKWWSSVNNPQRTYFLANGAKTVCTKNLGEFKSLYRGLLEYNVHENVWADQFCFGQYFAFTNSVRQTTWYSPARGGVWGASLRMNTISANGFSFSITQGDSGWLVITPGQAVCPIISNVFHCRTVASFDPATHSGTVTPAFSASTTNNPEWLYASDPTPGVIDLTIQNSVFRNVGSGPSMLMRDMAVLDSGNVGRVIRSTVRNNLFHTTLNMQNDYGLLVATQETNSVNSSAIGGGPLTYENNTYSYANRSAKSIYWNSNDSSPVARIQGLSLRSNIFPQASDDGSGNIYALGVSGIGFNNWCNIESVAGAPVTLKNNYLYHPSGVSASGCTHASVSGNIASGAPQYIAGTFKIAPGTVLSKAGHDGTDSGVRYDSLPLIRNLRVSPGAHAALLEFDLSAPVADAGARQPCVLEVSADSNLESYLGSYSVIPDLNPSFFKQPDHSARVNPLLLPVVVTDGHVAWPLGDARTTTGDDGLPHNLALTPGTQYYGRLQCYGDSRAFRFTTKSELSGGGSRTMQFAPLPSSATVRVDYGSTPEAGNSMSVAVDGLGRAAVDIPVTAGRYVYFRYAYQTVQGNELYRSGLKLSLP